jgi:mannosyltransferase OCH1-like enzyme
MATWRDAHVPLGWEYRVWSNECEREPGVPWRLQSIIDRMPEWNGKADIMRLEILAYLGGVVVDADSQCLAPLTDDMLEHEAWACWEHETELPGTIATGYLASVAGSPLMHDVLDEIEERASEPGWHLLPAWRSVGPTVFTRVAQRHPELHCFPAAAFIPEHYCGKPPAPYSGTVYARQFFGSTSGSRHFRYAGLE